MLFKSIGSTIILVVLPFFTQANEVECLALNIYYEARDQLRQGQYAVALVTLNRVSSATFPNSVCEVITQKNQFSWFWDGKSDSPYEEEAWLESLYLAKIIYRAYPNMYDNTQGALYYKKVGHPSKYFESLNYIVTIGDHEFYND